MGMQFFADERFGKGDIFMLNLLKYEPGNGKALYGVYARAATKKIGAMSPSKGGGATSGLKLLVDKVVCLKGTDFDSMAVMQYPSRQAFMAYAAANSTKAAKAANSGGGTAMATAFRYREAGLKTQGLVCFTPSEVFDHAFHSAPLTASKL